MHVCVCVIVCARSHAYTLQRMHTHMYTCIYIYIYTHACANKMRQHQLRDEGVCWGPIYTYVHMDRSLSTYVHRCICVQLFLQGAKMPIACRMFSTSTIF